VSLKDVGGGLRRSVNKEGCKVSEDQSSAGFRTILAPPPLYDALYVLPWFEESLRGGRSVTLPDASVI